MWKDVENAILMSILSSEREMYTDFMKLIVEGR
jgi:hypothetical protein